MSKSEISWENSYRSVKFLLEDTSIYIKQIRVSKYPADLAKYLELDTIYFAAMCWLKSPLQMYFNFIYLGVLFYNIYLCIWIEYVS